MAPSIQIDRPTRRRVQKLDRRTRDADLRIRCRVILKVAEGMSRHAAAVDVGCAPSTAWWIVDRFVRRGEASLLDGRCDNGERKVDEDILEGIWQILSGTPRDHGHSRNSWTLELLARVVGERLSVLISVGHLWRVIRQLRIHWGRPRAVVGCPWKAAKRKRRIAELRHLAENPPEREVVLYADEVDIHLNPKIGFDWMLPGVQRLVVTPGKNEKRYLAGAFDPIRQRMVYVEGPRKSSWLFLALLKELRKAYGWARQIHLILDNYSIHKSRLIQSALAALGKIRLHFLPPYCPMENRIEREWLDLHANVTRNHDHREMRALMGAVHDYLAARYWTYRGFVAP